MVTVTKQQIAEVRFNDGLRKDSIHKGTRVPIELQKVFLDSNQGDIGEDHTGAPVFLARNGWHLNKAQDDFPNLRFLATKEQTF